MPKSKQTKPSLFPELEADDLSSHAHRQLIGSVGLVLPVLLWLLAGWRPLDADDPWVPLSSVSAYYYSGAVAVFSGMLVALALFLFAYQGYDNEKRRRDRNAARLAGLAAMLVAVFPTAAPKAPWTQQWWTLPIGAIHYAGATLLFASFIYFALVLFPSSKKKSRRLARDKRIRNAIYMACGLAMVVCVIWAGLAGFRQQSIFLPEVLALEFFGIAWLVKGRALATAAAAARRAAYYTMHPRELAKDVTQAMREEPAPPRARGR